MATERVGSKWSASTLTALRYRRANESRAPAEFLWKRGVEEEKAPSKGTLPSSPRQNRRSMTREGTYRRHLMRVGEPMYVGQSVLLHLPNFEA